TESESFGKKQRRVKQQSRLTPQAKNIFPWRKPFLAALRQHGRVIYACQTARISRNSAYAHRRRYSRFRKGWRRAQEAGWNASWNARWEERRDEFFANLRQ